MNKMKKMIFVLGIAVSLVACSKEDTGSSNVVVETITVKDLPADTIIGITLERLLPADFLLELVVQLFIV